MSINPLTLENLETDATLEKCQPTELAQDQFVEWCAAKDLLYYDLDEMAVVKRPSLAKLARELGYSRQSLYKWQETIPAFEQRVAHAKEVIIQLNISAIWNAIFLKGMGGDVRACEMYLTAFDPTFIPARYKAKQLQSKQEVSLIDLLLQARELK